MKTKKIIFKLLIISAVITAMNSFVALAQPVSWTSYYEAGDNTFPPPPTVNLKCIAYNPVNNDVYVYGPKFFNLPAQPSGNVYTKELGVVRYNHLTGAMVNEVYDVHHDNTTLIPHFDEAGEMAIAADGSVYVTGKRYYDDVRGYDIVIIKYNSSLVEQWRIYYYGAGASSDSGVAVTVDPVTSNVYLEGQIGDISAGTGKDFFTAKFNPTGNPFWLHADNTTGSQNDYPKDIAINSATGDVYVTGYSENSTHGTEYTLMKFNSLGTKNWTKYYNGATGTGNDVASSVAVDPIINRIYITGTSDNISGNSDIATLAFNASGVKLWTKKVNNPGNSRDRGFKLVLSQEMVYVGGDVDRDTSANINGDLICRVYDSSGVVIRTKKYNGTGYNCEFGDIAATSAGTFYLTGWCLGAIVLPNNGTYSLMTVKYNNAGVLQWGDFLTPPQFSTCGEGYYGFKIAVNTANSEIAVGGRHWMWCPGAHPNEWLIRRYSPTLREGGTDFSSIDGTLEISAFPNPASDHLTLISNKAATIHIYDINGREVYQGTISDQQNEINCSQWTRGLYSIIVNDNGKNNTAVKKIMIQ
jgi:hypothetical protein